VKIFSIRISLVLGLLLLTSAIIWLTDADVRIARIIYQHGSLSDGHFRWPGSGVFPWQVIYDFAHIPGFILFGAALFILLGGFVAGSLNAYRRASLFLVLLLLIGPGLVVNVVLKDNYGRARPRELVEFGGKYHYTQIWEWGQAGKNSSFPSGHSSIGFYMMAPWFLLRRRKLGQGLCWLAGGVGFGLLVGAARMLQGGHFLSDVLWAGGLVYMTGEVLAFLILRKEPVPANLS